MLLDNQVYATPVAQPIVRSYNWQSGPVALRTQSSEEDLLLVTLPMAGQSDQPFFCQSCRSRLNITDIETLEQPGPSGRQSALLNASVFGGTKVDESFVLLDASKRGQLGHDQQHQLAGKLPSLDGGTSLRHRN